MPNKLKKRAVIVRLNNLKKKSKLVKASRLIKLDGIYVNNSLSKNTLELLCEARALRDKGVVKYVWKDECQVLVRVEEKGPVIKIKNYDHLKNIIEGKRAGVNTRRQHSQKNTQRSQKQSDSTSTMKNK